MKIILKIKFHENYIKNHQMSWKLYQHVSTGSSDMNWWHRRKRDVRCELHLLRSFFPVGTPCTHPRTRLIHTRRTSLQTTSPQTCVLHSWCLIANDGQTERDGGTTGLVGIAWWRRPASSAARLRPNSHSMALAAWVRSMRRPRPPAAKERSRRGKLLGLNSNSLQPWYALRRSSAR